MNGTLDNLRLVDTAVFKLGYPQGFELFVKLTHIASLEEEMVLIRLAKLMGSHELSSIHLNIRNQFVPNLFMIYHADSLGRTIL